MIALTYNKVDQFVAKLQRKGTKVRFVGWDMVFFKPDRRAEDHPAGRRLGNEWGFETTVSPNEQGNWLVNYGLTRG